MKKMNYLFLIIALAIGNTAIAQLLNLKKTIEKKYNQQFFIENKGQWPAEVLFLARMNGLNAWITEAGVVYDFYLIKHQQINDNIDGLMEAEKYYHSKAGHVIKVNNNLCSDNISIEKYEQEPFHHHYFIGNKNEKWQSNVSIFKEVIIKNIYKGIDQRWYFENNNLRYDYIVNTRADYKQIQLSIEGANNSDIQNGNLIFETQFGTVKQAELLAYQEIDGKKIPVNAKWKKTTSGFSFELGSYDKNKLLIIDPLVWSTFIGGGNDEEANAILVDDSGYVYVAGFSYSGDYPTTSGVYDNSHNGYEDVCVTKLKNDGSEIIFSTFIGGSGTDKAFGLAFDKYNNIYITGLTTSAEYPVSAGCFDNTINSYDIFVTKLNNLGNTILYSTFIGGSDWDFGNAIAIDTLGNAFITGKTWSNNFPTSLGCYDNSYNGDIYDVFVLKVNNDGSNLTYSTYIGGNDQDIANTISIDPGGNAYIGGHSRSGNYPTTAGAYNNTNYGGDRDAFITKLNSSGSALIFSTFIGGNNWDEIKSIAVDNDSNVYVTGRTQSSNFPITPGAFDTSYNGYYDAFITKLNVTGSGLIYSTFIAGTDIDEAYAIALDSSNNAYIAGTTHSSNYPMTSNSYDASWNGDYDAFVAKINAIGDELLFASFLGASGTESANALSLDKFGHVILTGYTNSNLFPVTSGSYDSTYNGSKDVFVTKLYLCPNDFVGVSISTNDTVCENTLVTLSGTGALYYSWSDSVINNIPFPADTTATYLVTGTDNHGCTDTASITIYVHQKPEITVTATPDTLCSGMQTVLQASGALTYLWDNGLGSANPVNATPASTTTYNVTGTDSNGCSNTANINVIVNPLPNITITATPDTLCSGMQTVLQASGALTYLWDNGLGSANPVNATPAATTTYNVTGTDSNGCSNSANINVIVNPLPNITVTATPDTLCSGMQTVLQASGALTYLWDNGLGSANPVNATPASTTTYNVTGTDSNGCSNAANIIVVVYNLPNVTASATPSTICQGNISELSASGALFFQWDNGLGNNNPVNVSPNNTTIYHVIGFDIHGCPDTATVTVTVNPLPDINVNQIGDTLIALQDSAIYQWVICPSYTTITGAQSQTFIPTIAGQYAAIIILNGCADTTACYTSNVMVPDWKNINDWVVYPNPNSGTFNIISHIGGPFELMDATGKIIATYIFESKKNITIQETLQKGLYLLREKNSGAIIKIIVQ